MPLSFTGIGFKEEVLFCLLLSVAVVVVASFFGSGFGVGVGVGVGFGVGAGAGEGVGAAAAGMLNVAVQLACDAALSSQLSKSIGESP